MLQAKSGKRQCLICGREIKGRSDKKFCNEGCRNSYNNRLKGNTSKYVRNINNVLLKNRKVLEKLLLPHSKETIRINKERLIKLGFQFQYMTHIYTTRKGDNYYFCYDYGYLPLNNDWYLIVKRKEDR